MNIGDYVLFLIDTGAEKCLLGEADAKRLAVDYSSLTLLPKDKWATGVGGVSPVYRIDHECTITFRTDLPIDHEHAFLVQPFPDYYVLKIDIEEEELRKRVVANLPSLLGIDLLTKFKLVVTNKKAFLEA